MTKPHVLKELLLFRLVLDQYLISAATQIWVSKSVLGILKNGIGTSLASSLSKIHRQNFSFLTRLEAKPGPKHYGEEFCGHS